MKCVNRNLAFDDNCDPILFPEKFEQQQQIQNASNKNNTAEDPIYFHLRMEILTVAVSENQIPIANLTLNELDVHFIS
jgi:hypothetical protein